MQTPAPSSPRSRWFLAIVATCFMVYMANGRELGLADTVPATLMPASILRDGDLRLDEFENLLDEPAPGGVSTIREQMAWTYAMRYVRDRRDDGDWRTARYHIVSSYPVGGAILATPVYALSVMRGTLHHFDDYRALGKTAASLFVALSAGLLFLCLERFVARGPAVFLTLTYACGTSAWVIASQAMWQHGPALLCLSLATWAALRLREADSRLMALLVSAGSAMAIVCRPQDAPGAAAIFALGLFARKRRALELVGPGAVIGALLVSYNLRTFGAVAGGYDVLYRSPAHAFRDITTRTVFTLPLMEGLSGLLVSPGKGLLFYSPVLAVGLGTVCFAARSADALLGRCLLFWVGVTLYFLSKNRLWWGGTSYGPRYLTELAFPLVLSMGMLWSRLAKSTLVTAAIAALGAYGFAVQLLGAVTWECGWHYYPAWLDLRLDRVWDYRDPEVLRCKRFLDVWGPRPADLWKGRE